MVVGGSVVGWANADSAPALVEVRLAVVVGIDDQCVMERNFLHHREHGGGDYQFERTGLRGLGGFGGYLVVNSGSYHGSMVGGTLVASQAIRL